MNASTAKDRKTRGLARIHDEWEAFGRTDPLWAILTWEGTQDGRWDETAFFKTGVEQIAESLQQLRQRRISLTPGRALDFGCGVGRLTQGLAAHFDQVTGVDISETMVSLAREKNRFGPKVTYVASKSPSLPVDDRSIDFLYSFIVLQHMPNDVAVGYIRDFGRVLAPGGIAMFQAPSHRTKRRLSYAVKRALQNYASPLYDWYWRYYRRAASTMELHPLHFLVVEQTLAASGLELAARITNASDTWADYWYVARKTA